MLELLGSWNFDLTAWVLACVCGFLVGFAKTGVAGAGILLVTIMAGLFPARQSPGILLPMLVIADVMAVWYYHRHADWRQLLRPMPWAVTGILLGVLFLWGFPKEAMVPSAPASMDSTMKDEVADMASIASTSNGDVNVPVTDPSVVSHTPPASDRTTALNLPVSSESSESSDAIPSRFLSETPAMVGVDSPATMDSPTAEVPLTMNMDKNNAISLPTMEQGGHSAPASKAVSLRKDQTFRQLIGGIVLACLIMQCIRDWRLKRKPENEDEVPHASYAFAVVIGILGGFTTMVANAAGPVWTVYLLAIGLPKYAFIGTGAWFFLILNTFKLPFQAWLGNITAASLAFDVVMIPAIVVGAVAGIYLVRKLNQEIFRGLVQIMTFIAALHLLIDF